MVSGHVAGPSQHDETVLEEAQRLITGDRNRAYDHPLDNFRRIADIWSVIFNIEITEEQVGLAMVGLKIARESFMPKRDNLVDGAGYFGTIQMVIEERERRQKEPYDGNAFCVNCNGKKEMVDGHVKISDSGRKVARGSCPDCGKPLNRLLGR